LRLRDADDECMVTLTDENESTAVDRLPAIETVLVWRVVYVMLDRMAQVEQLRHRMGCIADALLTVPA